MYRVFMPEPDGPVRRSFLTESVVQRMESMKNFHFSRNETGRPLSRAELTDALRDCDACLLNWSCSKLDSELLGKALKLKFIGVLGGGVRSFMDEDFFGDTTRVLVNSADVMAKSVAEAAMGYMISALREIPQYDKSMKSGTPWRSDDFFNRGLFYKTIGLVGLGRVGQYLIQYLKPFSVNFLIYDPYVHTLPQGFDNCRLTELDEVLTSAEIITIHAALTPETRHLLNHDKLRLIRDGGLLVNTARGGIIDEAALVRELSTGRFSAVLDVFEEEPLSTESPLRKLDNVTLIPHMGGPTIDMRQYMTHGLLDNMEAYFSGKTPDNLMTLQKYQLMT